MSGEVGDARKRLAEAVPSAADEGLVVRLRALADEWDKAASVISLGTLVGNGKRAVYLRCRNDIRALLDSAPTDGERAVWDAAYTPASVWEVGRVQGVIDAIKAHHPDASKGEFLSLIVTAPATDENPFEGVGDAVGILAAVEALLDDCDQVVDTPEHPNMVKVWAVRQVLAKYGAELHRWTPVQPVESAEREGRWKPSDGDTKCQVCHQPNGAWFADNEIWNAVLSDRVHEWLCGEVLPKNDPGGCYCPRCFMLLARERGMDIVWRLLPEWSGRALPMDPPTPTPHDTTEGGGE